MEFMVVANKNCINFILKIKYRNINIWQKLDIK